MNRIKNERFWSAVAEWNIWNPPMRFFSWLKTLRALNMVYPPESWLEDMLADRPFMKTDIYCGDDYPRDGCTAAIDVQAGHYVLSIYAPGAARPDRQPIEVYGARSPERLAEMLQDWCAGRAPRKTGCYS